MRSGKSNTTEDERRSKNVSDFSIKEKAECSKKEKNCKGWR